jgi:hypothetical protein
LLAPGNFRLDIVTRLSLHLVGVSSGPQPGSRKRIFDEIGSGIELRMMPHVALADFSRYYLDVLATGKTSIYKILNEDQKRKFDNLLKASQSK